MEVEEETSEERSKEVKEETSEERSSSPDLLLLPSELPPQNENYFKKISSNVFIQSFSNKPLFRITTRLHVTIPLQISPNEFVPIPFIVDTGSPGFMHLGSGAENMLRGLNVIQGEGNHVRLQGKCCGFGKSYNNPTVHILSEHQLNQRGDLVKDDCRLNLLGLDGIEKLNVLDLRVPTPLGLDQP